MESLPKLILTVVFIVLVNHASSVLLAWSTFRFPTRGQGASHNSSSPWWRELCDGPGLLSLRRKSTRVLSPPPRQKVSCLSSIQVLPSKVSRRFPVWFLCSRGGWKKLVRFYGSSPSQLRAKLRSNEQDVCRRGMEEGQLFQNGETLQGQYVRG